MTNEEFMQRAQLQKVNAEYAVDDWFTAAFLWVAFIAIGLVALALCAFALLTVDVTPVAPTSVIILLLVWIVIKMDKK